MRTERPTIKSYADKLRDIVQNRTCLKFSPKEKVPAMIDRMRQHGQYAGAVIDPSGAFVGLVTEREIVRRIFGRFEPHHGLEHLHEHKAVGNMTAWDVMITSPDTLHVADTIEDALDLIIYFGYRYMPVVEKPGKLAGIVEAEELRKHVKAKARALKETDHNLLPFMMPQELQNTGSGFFPDCIERRKGGEW